MRLLEAADASRTTGVRTQKCIGNCTALRGCSERRCPSRLASSGASKTSTRLVCRSLRNRSWTASYQSRLIAVFCLSKRRRKGPQQLGKLSLSEVTGRETNHTVIQTHLRVADEPAVQIKEDERGVERSPLV